MPSQAHVRIDEGVKRGPRVKPLKTHQDAPRSNLTVAKRPMSHLAPEERQKIAHTVLDRYINGEQVAAMAPEYNVSDVTLYALLLREHETAWKDIQSARALARLESAQEGLKSADDALSLARARELVRSAQWELERLVNRLYGQKQEITHTITPVFNIVTASVADTRQVAAQQGHVIDVTPEQQIIPGK